MRESVGGNENEHQTRGKQSLSGELKVRREIARGEWMCCL